MSESKIGQNLINRPAHDLRATQSAEKRADQKRSESKSVLNLADVLSKKKAAADIALAEINQNQAAWATQLTQQDLQRFKRKVADLQKDLTANKIMGGITPNAVISRSRTVDIRRAEQEIYTVQAVKFDKDGVMTFRTNASKKYGATYHVVRVQFLNFQAALNAGSLNNKFLDDYLKSAVKFDCDCGRHRYWYRYIATVGGFALGQPETAFPKVRNPELTGVACKHVVRVMHTLARKPTALRQAAKMHIERYRKNPNQVAKTLTKKQAKQSEFVAAQGVKIRKVHEKMAQEIQAAIDEKLKNANLGQLAHQVAHALKSGAISQKDYDAIMGILSK